MIPALRWSKRYHRIIQLLMHHEEGMTINEISEARQWPINFLTLWIDHLVKAGALKKDTLGLRGLATTPNHGVNGRRAGCESCVWMLGDL